MQIRNVPIFRNGVQIMRTESYVWHTQSPYLHVGEIYHVSNGYTVRGAISEVVEYNRHLPNFFGVACSFPNFLYLL